MEHNMAYLGSPLRKRVQLKESKLLDSPARCTRSQTQRLGNIEYEFGSEVKEHPEILLYQEKEQKLIMIDWINDIPFIAKLMDFISLITISVIALSKAGLNMIKLIHQKINRGGLEQIKHFILFSALLFAGMYLLASKKRSFGELKPKIPLNITDQIAVNEAVPSHQQQKFDEKVDSLWLLLQSQINPIIKDIKTLSEELNSLKQQISSPEKTESPAILQDLVAVNEELENKVVLVSIKVDNLTEKLLDNQKATDLRLNQLWEAEMEKAVSQVVKKSIQELVISSDEKFKQEKDSFMLLVKQITNELVQSSLTQSDTFELYERFGPDYSLRDAGASIITENTSGSYFDSKDKVSSALHIVGGPKEVLDPSLLPGHCWGMKGILKCNQGSRGHVEIQLARPITISAFVVAHAHPSMLYKNGIKSSPKKVSVYAILNNRENLLASFDFDPRQGQKVVPIKSNLKNVDRVLWRIHDNWGNDKWTCIYRFGVHGVE